MRHFFPVSNVVLFYGKLIHHGYGACRALYFSLFLLVFGYFFIIQCILPRWSHPESTKWCIAIANQAFSYDLAPRPCPPPFSPVRKLDRRRRGRLRKRLKLLTGDWRKGVGRPAKSYDRKKAWSSINHSLLCSHLKGNVCIVKKSPSTSNVTFCWLRRGLSSSELVGDRVSLSSSSPSSSS